MEIINMWDRIIRIIFKEYVFEDWKYISMLKFDFILNYNI